MALRITKNENAMVAPGKVFGGPQQPIMKRTALGDVGNKQLPNVRGGKEDIKKATVQMKFLPSKRTVQIKTEKTNRTTLKSEPTNVSKKADKLPDETVQLPPKQEKPSSPSPMEVSSSEIDDLTEAFSSKQLLQFDDIDSADKDNPQLMSELVADIYRYLWEVEERTPIRQKYLEGKEINGRMRAILIDWLVDVHLRFHLLPETLYLTVAIMDRFLQNSKNITKNTLQLVGITAMFIASKYEEMYAPELSDFVYLADNAYSKREILQMECRILAELDFSITRPIQLNFLRRNSKAGSVNATQHTLAKYLMELCLTEYSLCHYKPSHIAAASLCLSLRILSTKDMRTEKPWNDTLQYFSNYSYSQLITLMQKICGVVVRSESSKFTATKSKYAGTKFLKISCIPELSSRFIRQMAAGMIP